jgi:hypothetical protein
MNKYSWPFKLCMFFPFLRSKGGVTYPEYSGEGWGGYFNKFALNSFSILLYSSVQLLGSTNP